MDESTLLGELEEVARSLGVDVRYESMKREGSFTSGGLCRLRGTYLLIVNSKASVRDKIEALAVALKRFDLSRLYIKPGLRDYLERLPAAGRESRKEDFSS